MQHRCIPAEPFNLALGLAVGFKLLTKPPEPIDPVNPEPLRAGVAGSDPRVLSEHPEEVGVGLDVLPRGDTGGLRGDVPLNGVLHQPERHRL